MKRSETGRINGDFVGGELRLATEPAGLPWHLTWLPPGVNIRPIEGRTPYVFKELPVGRYNVEFQREGGWVAQTIVAEIKKGDTTSKSGEFPSGSLRVDSTPSGAEVLISGKVVGKTPFQLPEVVPGAGGVELRLKGYKSQTLTAQIVGKQELRLNATLEKWEGPLAGEAFGIPALNLTILPIAPGTFRMGDEGSWGGQPYTQVTIAQPFWLGATEVTQGQYEALMGTNPSNFKGADRPVEQVSWDDAMAFCRKLTERERAAGRLPDGYVYTLPTEAQWEYACRSGTTGDYAGNLDSMGWYNSNSGNQTHPVAQKQANAWGLSDMHGNVWEWCLDWKGDYPGGSVTDPTGPSSGSDRVNRGGGWDNTAVYCRSAIRSRNDRGIRNFNLGFRLALSSVR